jgi:GTP-binding protein HflX
LEARWQRETHYNAVFISATEKRNIEGLRNTILDKVRQHYAVRYPYKTNFY